MNLSFQSVRRYTVIICLLGLFVPTLYSQDTPEVTPEVAPKNAPIMPFADVRIGMKGYGLSVFHGTKIEVFPVEVISTVSDSSPKRGTIWIRCTSLRMQKSGPVQGMSGSPIFLWDEDEQGEPGQGGRLVGAFAFGFGLSKDCIVGVQPIELMRDIAQRKDEPAVAQTESWNAAHKVMASLAEIARQRGIQPNKMYRFDMLRSIMGEQAVTPQPVTAAVQTAKPLLLPMSVGSNALAAALSPLYEPMGLSLVSGGTLAGAPPVGTDIEGTKLEPGSVLAVPLVFGDLDLAASGTVTDVLSDGTVLGFGHPMFSQGATALPMATGYVHFIVPSITISFKQGGSLRMIGSLVRDEETGVLGIPQQRYDTATAKIDLTLSNGDDESYEYELVNYRPLTAMLAATVVIRSLIARHDLPMENTIDLDATLRFEGDREFEIHSSLPGMDFTAPIFELLPPLAMLSNNPFQPLKLESMQVKIAVRRGIDSATIVAARLDHAEIAPGATVRVAVDIQPYGGEIRTLHTTLDIPTDLPEGNYQLAVSGAQQYATMRMASRPHRMNIHNVDQLMQMLRDMTSAEGKAVYLLLQGQDQDAGSIAVGRTEMANLPSSRAALLASATHTLATPFTELVFSQLDTDTTIEGETNFQLSVRHGAYGAKHD